jgi:thiamine biosynthesis protein ThiS
MKILLNDREEYLDKESLTISQLLILKKLSFKMRIIKINGTLIQKDSYDNIYLKDGDHVQIIYLMSGG